MKLHLYLIGILEKSDRVIMKYIPQIDTLRFFCALIVILRHLPIIPNGSVFSYLFMYITGVDVFFVLSGFLITAILLQKTDKPVGSTLFSFYSRRFLRIFPIYYLCIFLLLIINPSDYREYAIYDILYISNFKMGLDGDFSTVTPHFWSLAVEEQFYLFWPFFLLIVFKSKQLAFLIFSVLIGLFSYVYFHLIDDTFFGARTFNNIAFLSGGGILAWVSLNRSEFYTGIFNKVCKFILVAFFGIGILCAIFSFRYSVVLGFVSSFVFSIAIVQVFSCDIDGLFKKIFLFKPFVLLGKVSYGMYLYHMLMIIPFTILVSLFNLESVFHDHLYLINLTKISLTIIFALFSWFLIERPLLKLKERFSY